MGGLMHKRVCAQIGRYFIFLSPIFSKYTCFHVNEDVANAIISGSMFSHRDLCLLPYGTTVEIDQHVDARPGVRLGRKWDRPLSAGRRCDDMERSEGRLHRLSKHITFDIGGIRERSSDGTDRVDV